MPKIDEGFHLDKAAFPLAYTVVSAVLTALIFVGGFAAILGDTALS